MAVRNGRDSVKLVAGNSNRPLAEAIASYLSLTLTKCNVRRFADMEIFVEIHENVRGQDTFIIQSTSYPANDNLMELLVTLDALKRGSARRITAVMPYFGYARQDRKSGPRTPISAKLVANLIVTAGANRVLTMDLHAGQIQGFFSIPGDVLTTFHILVEYMSEIQHKLHDPVVVAADLGFAKKGRNFAARIDTPIAFVEKRRSGDNGKAEALSLIGDVRGRDAIVIDDEVDTGGSVSQAVMLCQEHGARNIYLVFVHPVLSHNAADRLGALPLTQMITTDTVRISAEKRRKLGERLTVLSVAPLLGEVMKRAHEGRSVGELFNE